MELKQLLITYLQNNHVMQIASAKDKTPWVCTVYYVLDDELNIYWCSIPERRHSREINENPRTAVAVTVQSDIDKQVIGIQGEGISETVNEYATIKQVALDYAYTFGRDKEWVEAISRGETQHKLYKFIPERYMLFDEENFPNDPQQEIVLYRRD